MEVNGNYVITMEEERFRTLTDSQFRLYVEKLSEKVRALTRYYCLGCTWDSLSQTSHDCVDMAWSEMLENYFEEAWATLIGFDVDDIYDSWVDINEPNVEEIFFFTAENVSKTEVLEKLTQLF